MALVNRAGLAAMVDHTLLSPTATSEDVRALVAEALELGVGTVCVSPTMVTVAAEALAGAVAPVGLASVVGFPSGAHRVQVKAAEAATAVADGATEVDVVANLSAVASGDLDLLAAETEAIRSAVGPDVAIKIILESAAILAIGELGSARLESACRTAADAGADLVKTSTGFHPAGGASAEAVALMAAAVGGRGSGSVGVKASGGIRTAAVAVAMVTAGATRIGASASRAILADLLLAEG